MASFRENKSDRDNINTIITQRGGISKSDALRVAVAETATRKPQLVLMPLLPPLEQFEATVQLMKAFHGTWHDAVRIGWPDHLPGESEERKKKVEAARKLNEEALEEFGPSTETLRVLLAMILGANAVDIRKAQDPAKSLNATFERNYAIMKDSKSSPEEKKRASDWCTYWAPLLAILRLGGLIPDPSDQPPAS